MPADSTTTGAEQGAMEAAPRLRSYWHEDMGDQLWWVFPITEPPYCGSPLCDDWPGYHTHFTPIPIPEPPPSAEQGAMEVARDLANKMARHIVGENLADNDETCRVCVEFVAAALTAFAAAQVTEARREGERNMRERALQWVHAIHDGKDNSRDPAVVHNVCSRIEHAIRALPLSGEAP